MVEHVQRPLAVYHFRLTTVDALAFERLPGEWSGWRKAAAILPVMAIGVFAGLIEDWSRLWWWVSVVGLLVIWALAGLVVLNLRLHRRARVLAAREGSTEVEQWGDHLVVRSQGGTTHLADAAIGKVIIGDGHVFVLWRDGQIIMPLRAFEDAAAMRAFGDEIDRRSMEAAP